MNYEKFSRSYCVVALMLLNICVIFLVLNIAIFGAILIKENFLDTEAKPRDPVSEKYGIQSLKKVHPQLTEETIYELFHETWSRPFVYEPFTQFKERPYEGRFVNVDQNGFRASKSQGAWPPDPRYFNVFMFGGSTAFGYGVADGKTVASHLQGMLADGLKKEVRIYNFGRGFYYSTQERILFAGLLISGFVPDMAIFLDGLNEFYHRSDAPLFTSRLRKRFDEEPVKPESMELYWLDKVPIVRFAKSIAYRTSKLFAENNDKSNDNSVGVVQVSKQIDAEEGKYNDEFIITSVVSRYLENKKIIEAISEAFGVRPVFVFQPVPTYKYDTNYHLFVGDGFGAHTYSKYGYQYLEEFIKENPLGNNFLWLADIQQNLQRPLYVDQVHYSAEMSELLAIAISELIFERF